MIKIIIADDHQLFIEGISSLLLPLKNMELVATVNNGRQLLAVLADTPCDLILMDINMPEMDGLEATKQVKASYTSIKILMLSMFDTRDYISKLLAAGADGYILKNTGSEELQKAINTIMEGEAYYSKEVTARIMEGLQKKKSHSNNTNVELTEREIEVLKLIANEFTTAEIAEKLFISTHTVETHRKNLISKLNVKNVAGLVVYAMHNGLIE